MTLRQCRPDDSASAHGRVFRTYPNSPTAYWPAANDRYLFEVDSYLPITLTGDPASVSAYDTGGGGVYWGTMKSGNVFLPEGRHSIEVTGNSMWKMLDYFELHSLSVGNRVEAELNYSVVTDVGTRQIGADSRAVGFFDTGDTIRIPFHVPTDGYYQLSVRVRSGHVWNPAAYWPAANDRYLFKVDSSNPVTLTGDVNTISAYDLYGGGTYWGTMKSTDVYLSSGTHSIDITDNSMWEFADYFQLLQGSQ